MAAVGRPMSLLRAKAWLEELQEAELRRESGVPTPEPAAKRKGLHAAKAGKSSAKRTKAKRSKAKLQDRAQIAHITTLAERTEREHAVAEGYRTSNLRTKGPAPIISKVPILRSGVNPTAYAKSRRAFESCDLDDVYDDTMAVLLSLDSLRASCAQRQRNAAASGRPDGAGKVRHERLECWGKDATLLAALRDLQVKRGTPSLPRKGNFFIELDKTRHRRPGSAAPRARSVPTKQRPRSAPKQRHRMRTRTGQQRAVSQAIASAGAKARKEDRLNPHELRKESIRQSHKHRVSFLTRSHNSFNKFLEIQEQRVRRARALYDDEREDCAGTKRSNNDVLHVGLEEGIPASDRREAMDEDLLQGRPEDQEERAGPAHDARLLRRESDASSASVGSGAAFEAESANVQSKRNVTLDTVGEDAEANDRDSAAIDEAEAVEAIMNGLDFAITTPTPLAAQHRAQKTFPASPAAARPASLRLNIGRFGDDDDEDSDILDEAQIAAHDTEVDAIMEELDFGTTTPTPMASRSHLALFTSHEREYNASEEETVDAIMNGIDFGITTPTPLASKANLRIFQPSPSSKAQGRGSIESPRSGRSGLDIDTDLFGNLRVDGPISAVRSRASDMSAEELDKDIFGDLEADDEELTMSATILETHNATNDDDPDDDLFGRLDVSDDE